MPSGVGDKASPGAPSPRETGGEDGDHVQRDQPHREIHGEEIGEERNAAALGGGPGFFAGRNGVAVLLHQVEVEHQQRQEEQRQDDHVQAKKRCTVASPTSGPPRIDRS